MSAAQKDHDGSVSIWGQLITTFFCVDDIFVNAEVDEKVDEMVDYLNTTTINTNRDRSYQDETEWWQTTLMTPKDKLSEARSTTDFQVPGIIHLK